MMKHFNKFSIHGYDTLNVRFNGLGKYTKTYCVTISINNINYGLDIKIISKYNRKQSGFSVNLISNQMRYQQKVILNMIFVLTYIILSRL